MAEGWSRGWRREGWVDSFAGLVIESLAARVVARLCFVSSDRDDHGSIELQFLKLVVAAS